MQPATRILTSGIRVRGNGPADEDPSSWPLYFIFEERDRIATTYLDTGRPRIRCREPAETDWGGGTLLGYEARPRK
jgi:hypothetical protein